MIQFPSPFNCTPIVIANPRSDNNYVSDDGMVVNVQNVTNSSFTALVRKVGSGDFSWSQSLQISYSAHVPSNLQISRVTVSSPLSPRVYTTTTTTEYEVPQPRYVQSRFESPVRTRVSVVPAPRNSVSPTKSYVQETHYSPSSSYTESIRRVSPVKTTTTTIEEVHVPTIPVQITETVRRVQSPARAHHLVRTDNHSPHRTVFPRIPQEVTEYVSPIKQLNRTDQHIHSPHRMRPSPTAVRRIETVQNSPGKHMFVNQVHVTPTPQVYYHSPKSNISTTSHTIITTDNSPPRQVTTPKREGMYSPIIGIERLSIEKQNTPPQRTMNAVIEHRTPDLYSSRSKSAGSAIRRSITSAPTVTFSPNLTEELGSPRVTAISRSSFKYSSPENFRRITVTATEGKEFESPKVHFSTESTTPIRSRTPVRPSISQISSSPESALITRLSSEQYGSNQVEMIKTFLMHYSGTLKSSFVLDILSCVHMESNKVLAFQLIVDSLKYSLDGHDIARLLSTFTMTSRKRELLNMIFDKKARPPMNLSAGASVQQILSQIPMDSHKIEALRMMGPYIIDCDSMAASQIVNSFTQQLHKNQARTILGL
jgi:hypothetical protein